MDRKRIIRTLIDISKGKASLHDLSEDERKTDIWISSDCGVSFANSNGAVKTLKQIEKLHGQNITVQIVYPIDED